MLKHAKRNPPRDVCFQSKSNEGSILLYNVWGVGFTRILPLIAPNRSVRQRHNAVLCFITAENSLNFEKTAQNSYFVDIFKNKRSKVYVAS